MTEQIRIDSAQTADHPKRMRWRITDLFFVMVVIAGLAFGVANLGVTNWRSWAAAAIPMILTLICFSLLRVRMTKVAIVLLSILVLPSFCIGGFFFRDGFPVFLIIPVLIALSIAVFKEKISIPLATRIGISLTVIVYCGFSWFGHADVAELRRLRSLFPIESVEQRLAYEDEFEGQEPVPITPYDDIVGVNKEYEDDVSARPSYSREFTLARIHSVEYEKFVRANGFGISRVPFPSEQTAQPPILRSIEFTQWSDPDFQSTWRRRRQSRDEFFGLDFDARDPVVTFHRGQFYDFLHPRNLGWVAGDRKAAGFVPHGFHRLDNLLVQRTVNWQLQKLELVSLRRFEEPRAYVLDHLPRMDHLSGDTVPTRALSEFERAGLEQLRDGKETHSAEVNDQLLMVGALRASNTCLNCHSAKEGELLGAFTYEFRPQAGEPVNSIGSPTNAIPNPHSDNR